MDRKIDTTRYRDTVDHCLFQARMWRNYAIEWDLPTWHDRRRWVEHILRIDREDCLKEARKNLIAARFLLGGERKAATS